MLGMLGAGGSMLGAVSWACGIWLGLASVTSVAFSVVGFETEVSCERLNPEDAGCLSAIELEAAVC